MATRRGVVDEGAVHTQLLSPENRSPEFNKIKRGVGTGRLHEIGPRGPNRKARHTGALWFSARHAARSLATTMMVDDCSSKYPCCGRCRGLYTGVWWTVAVAAALLSVPSSTSTVNAFTSFNSFVGRVPSTGPSSSPTVRFDASHFEGWR